MPDFSGIIRIVFHYQIQQWEICHSPIERVDLFCLCPLGHSPPDHKIYRPGRKPCNDADDDHTADFLGPPLFRFPKTTGYSDDECSRQKTPDETRRIAHLVRSPHTHQGPQNYRQAPWITSRPLLPKMPPDLRSPRISLKSAASARLTPLEARALNRKEAALRRPCHFKQGLKP